MWTYIRDFFRHIVPAIFFAARQEAARAARTTANFTTRELNEAGQYIGPRAGFYYRTFIRTALIIIFIPLVSIGIALILKVQWLIPITGILMSLLLAILLFRPVYFGIASALGAVSSILHWKNPIDGGLEWAKKLLNFFLSILLWELCLVLFLSVAHIENNPKAIPIILLSGIIIGLFSWIHGRSGKLFRGLAYLFVFFVLIFEIGTLVLPKTANATAKTRGKLDDKLAGWFENPTWPEWAKFKTGGNEDGKQEPLAKQSSAVEQEITIAPTCPPQNTRVVTIPLRPDCWSKEEVPPRGVTIDMDGPPEARVLFSDGDGGSIHKDYPFRPVQCRKMRFCGPAGTSVRIEYRR